MKKNIIVLFGGKSAEHDISLITANLVLNAIDEEKYNVYPVFVDKQNKWFYVKDFKNNIQNFKQKEEIFLKIGEDALFVKRTFLLKNLINVDCAILCHHGVNGEDGTIQSVLKLCNIPYSSSNTLSSAITMDKVVMKLLFKEFGFNVIDYFYFNKQEYENSKDNIINKLENELNYPVILKPANLGSSIGINIAKNKEELINAINVAFSFDNKVLVEKALENFTEINCAVMGYGKEVIVSSLEEPVSWKEFLTFEDKYEGNSKKSPKRIYPAKVPEEIKKNIQKVSKLIFEKFELCGVVRIDFIIKNDEIYVNEINSIPGSLAYYLFEKEEYSFTNVIDNLINFALKKYENENLLTYAFESNVLKNQNIKK